MMYKDYWQDNTGPEDSGGEDNDEEDNDSKDIEGDAERKSKLLPSSDEEDEDEVTKSSHEKAQERLAKKISKMEEAAVGDKSWQMGGEVAAPVRPENSLLSEHLEYDSAARQAPVITES